LLTLEQRLSSWRQKLETEWSPLNGSAQFADVSFSDRNQTYQWRCAKGHDWFATPNSRWRGSECRECSTQPLSSHNNLATLRPEIACIWHPIRNDAFKPADVSPGSHRVVWWQCDRGHEWQWSVKEEVQAVGSCPYCTNKRVSKENCLAVIAPQLVDEWHPYKNTLTPWQVTAGSNKKVWWVCRLGHEWAAVVWSRTKGHGCPECSPNTSRPELRVRAELGFLFPDAVGQTKIAGHSVDVVIPSLCVAVEIDGYFWHERKAEADQRKTEVLRSHGYKLYRLRDARLKMLSPDDVRIAATDGVTPAVMKLLVERILKDNRFSMDNGLAERVIAYVHRSKFAADHAYQKFTSVLPGPLTENSLRTRFPEIAKEWHPTLNVSMGLTPDAVSYASGRHCWWLCARAHEWRARVTSRTINGNGCPYCSGNRVTKERSLAVVHPEVAIEWDWEANGELTPHDVLPSSNCRVGWVCKVCAETYRARVASRSRGTSCPYCANLRVNATNSLLAMCPQIASQWHPTKNADLTPDQVVFGSAKRVWWLCSLRSDHEWQAQIVNRTRAGQGCPYCAGKRPDSNSSLRALYPAIASEWHPSKNGQLTPDSVTAGSAKKVWWLCGSSHEWFAVIKSRTKLGAGCRECYRNRR